MINESTTAKQTTQNPGNWDQKSGSGDNCGAYVVVTQDIRNNRLRKSAQAIVRKWLTVSIISATARIIEELRERRLTVFVSGRLPLQRKNASMNAGKMDWNP